MKNDRCFLELYFNNDTTKKYYSYEGLVIREKSVTPTGSFEWIQSVKFPIKVRVRTNFRVFCKIVKTLKSEPIEEIEYIEKNPPVENDEMPLSEWFIVEDRLDWIVEPEIILDGKKVTNIKIGKINGKTRFLGPDELRGKLNSGLHYISAIFNSDISHKIYFWKEASKLSLFDKNKFGKNYALLLGITKYQDNNLKNLKKITRQVKELEKILLQNDFTVTCLLDSLQTVTLDVVNDSLSKLNTRIKNEEDNLFFYFGGHGKAVKPASGDSVSFLLLNNYDLNNLENTCISMDDIFSGKYMKHIKGKHVLFAIDACHAGLGIHAEYLTVDDEKIKAYIELNSIYDLYNSPGRAVLTAGTGSKKVIYDDDQGGLFTTMLINAFGGDADFSVGDKNGVLIMNELETYLRNYVSAAAKPQEQIPDRLDRGNGEFIFFHLR